MNINKGDFVAYRGHGGRMMVVRIADIGTRPDGSACYGIHYCQDAELEEDSTKPIVERGGACFWEDQDRVSPLSPKMALRAQLAYAKERVAAREKQNREDRRNIHRLAYALQQLDLADRIEEEQESVGKP